VKLSTGGGREGGLGGFVEELKPATQNEKHDLRYESAFCWPAI